MKQNDFFVQNQLFLEPLDSSEREWLKLFKETDIKRFANKLKKFSCKRCTLSELNSQRVVYRGATNADIMLIGEAPGKVENAQGFPFVGPAGKLLEKMFKAININIDDIYLGNICKCRPRAPMNSGKQNFTPNSKQHKACLPYLEHEIKLVKPKIIIAAGATAAKVLFDFSPKTLMKHIVGSFFQKNEPLYLSGKQLIVIYHPAALLYPSARQKELKEETLLHLKKIREMAIKLNVI